LHARARERCRLIEVDTVSALLPAGDYSIEGCERLVAVERKSLEDLYASLSQHRERFEAEHERLSDYDYAAVVVEATWRDVLLYPPERSRLLPKSVRGTILAWSRRYGVHWHLVEDRRLAERTTFDILRGWWEDATRELGP
jgi:ERCC4-type nuclease